MTDARRDDISLLTAGAESDSRDDLLRGGK